MEATQSLCTGGHKSPTPSVSWLAPTRPMSFTDAFRALNALKRRRIIRDYTVIGAVAATAYMEPMATEDLDIIVLVDTDEEYLRVFNTVAANAEGHQGMHYELGGVPVQMFPSTIMPLYRDTVAAATQVRIGGLRVNFASIEHLKLLYLQAFREKDQLRVQILDRMADGAQLNALLQRFDDAEEKLTRRLQELRGTSVPREGEVALQQGEDEPGPQT